VIAVRPHQHLRALFATKRKHAAAGSHIPGHAWSTTTQRRRSGPSSCPQIASCASDSAGGFSRSGQPAQSKQTSGPSGRARGRARERAVLVGGRFFFSIGRSRRSRSLPSGFGCDRVFVSR